MLNEQSQLSSTVSPTTTKGSTLQRIQEGARKMAGYKGGPKSLEKSLLGISDKLARSKAFAPTPLRVDGMTPVMSECLSWGFPRRHLQEPTENLDRDGKWFEKLKMLSKLHGTGFLVSLLGDRWTGKTMMACRLARLRLARDKKFTALYVRAAEFFIAIKDSYRDGGPSESSQIQRFCEADLLVIDELNERGDTRWEDMMLTLLIDKRYGDVRDTLVISNHTPEAFQESVGASIYRRLVQTGGQIVCDWPSFRDAAVKRKD